MFTVRTRAGALPFEPRVMSWRCSVRAMTCRLFDLPLDSLSFLFAPTWDSAVARFHLFAHAHSTWLALPLLHENCSRCYLVQKYIFYGCGARVCACAYSCAWVAKATDGRIGTRRICDATLQAARTHTQRDLGASGAAIVIAVRTGSGSEVLEQRHG